MFIKKGKFKQKGVSFLEVLIALAILVTGILGAVAMQAITKKGGFDAMQRSLASSLAQDIIERMRNNNEANLALYAANSPYGAGVVANPPTCNSSINVCNPIQMVTNDLFGWEQVLMGADVNNGNNNAGGLLEASGCITQVNNAVTVVISWQGRTETAQGGDQDCGAAGNKRRQVVVEAFIY